MSESCGCPYAGLKIEELKLLDPKDLIKILNKAIPVLFKNGGQESKILQMAALPADFSGNSGDVNDAIRAIVSWEIRGGELYLWGYDSKVIESIGKIISCLEEGKDFWIKELVRSLEAQKNLKEFRVWLKYSNSLNKVAKVFQIEGTIENILQKTIESDESINKFGFWKDNHSKIIKFIETFGFVKKTVTERAEGMLNSDGRSIKIGCWNEQSFLVSFLIKDLSLQKRTKELINLLIVENTERVNKIHTYTTEESIEKYVNDLTKSGDYSFMNDCLMMAKTLDISIEPDMYQEMADNLLILANKLERQDVREAIVKIACSIYKGLEKEYRYPFRNSIIKAFTDINGNKDRAVLKEASKIIPNFKYKKQNWKDF